LQKEKTTVPHQQ